MLLVVLGVFGLIIAGGFLLAGKLFHIRLLRILGWAGICFWSIPICLYTVMELQTWLFENNPSAIFKSVFGTVPSSEVTQLHARSRHCYELLGYSGDTYLRFRISEVGIKRLTVQGWQRVSVSDRARDDFSILVGSSPSWWRPDAPEVQVPPRYLLLTRKDFNQGHSGITCLLLYDRQRMIAYSGIVEIQ